MEGKRHSQVCVCVYFAFWGEREKTKAAGNLYHNKRMEFKHGRGEAITQKGEEKGTERRHADQEELLDPNLHFSKFQRVPISLEASPGDYIMFWTFAMFVQTIYICSMAAVIPKAAVISHSTMSLMPRILISIISAKLLAVMMKQAVTSCATVPANSQPVAI